MTSHSVPGQMLGYLYQVRYALKLLLENDDPNYQISLEKFDDIAFDSNGEPIELIQVKHHTTPASLSDSSVDLWRTLNVWLDAIEHDNTLLENTDFVIITTASVPPGSAADKIVNEDCDGAYRILENIANRILGNIANSPKSTILDYCKHFLQFRPDNLLKLLHRIKIISSVNNIREMIKDIVKSIQYSCMPEHLPKVIERVEGWWFQECIKALMSEALVITTHGQLHSKVVEIARQYGEDNLPVEFWKLEEIEEEVLNPKDRIFLEHLKLLQCQSMTLRLALQDYYRAFRQRSSWIRQGLLYPNELDDYEIRLVDSWKHAFADMEENLGEYDTPSEKEKQKEGKNLFSRVMEKDIPIRKYVDATYVMKGTYHHLANRLKIGWHVDFFYRLSHLLEEGASE